MNNDNYKQSFFWTIVWFILFDICTLLGWINPKFLWLSVIIMLLIAYFCVVYISEEIGVSKGLAVLIATVLFLSYIGALFLKGYLSF